MPANGGREGVLFGCMEIWAKNCTKRGTVSAKTCTEKFITRVVTKAYLLSDYGDISLLSKRLLFHFCAKIS